MAFEKHATIVALVIWVAAVAASGSLADAEAGTWIAIDDDAISTGSWVSACGLARDAAAAVPDGKVSAQDAAVVPGCTQKKYIYEVTQDFTGTSRSLGLGSGGIKESAFPALPSVGADTCYSRSIDCTIADALGFNLDNVGNHAQMITL